MKRIAVVGVTGSGKTTLARQIGERLGIKHVEMDSLHWEANWQEAPIEVFRQRTQDGLDPAGCWVVDGNYSKVRDIIWERADTIVWLDYPLIIPLWRLFKRTLRRVVLRETLWAGNRESVRNAFFSKDSLFLWAFTSQPRQRATYPALIASPEYAHLRLIRLYSPGEAKRWLESLS